MAKAKLPKVGHAPERVGSSSILPFLDLWSLTSGYELGGSTQTVAPKEPQPGFSALSFRKSTTAMAGLEGLDSCVVRC